MRGIAIVTIAFENGTVFRGTATDIENHPPRTMRVGGFGPFSQEVVIEPGRMSLEVVGLEPVPTPSPMAPAEEPEPDHEESLVWGAYA